MIVRQLFQVTNANKVVLLTKITQKLQKIQKIKLYKM